MWSIWFYFTSGMFEACGFESREAAILAHNRDVFFKDEGGNDVFVPLKLQGETVAKFCKS